VERRKRVCDVNLSFYDTKHQNNTLMHACTHAHTRRIVRRWSRASLLPAFLRWQEMVDEFKLKASIALKTIARMRNRLMAQSWARWIHMVDAFCFSQSVHAMSGVAYLGVCVGFFCLLLCV